MNFPGKQNSSGSKEVDLNPLLPELFVLQGFSVRKNKSAKPFVSTVSHFCGPSGETRTRGILVPNQAPFQLGHTRILNQRKMLVVVKYVVKEILPQFYGAFNGSNQG